MKPVERSFRLEAPSGLGAHPRPELIGPVLARVHEALLDSVRMGFRHSSRARGRVPGALKAAAEVRYIGHAAVDESATVLRFEVPTFGEAAADLFAQAQLWDDGPRPEQTAFELLGAAINDVAVELADSSRFDADMLNRIAHYRRLFRGGALTRIVLPDSETQRMPSLDAGVTDAALRLARATPEQRRVRVTGRLDLLGVSQGVLKIHVADGAVVTALWEGSDAIEAFSAHLNRDVVCEGVAMFRPSGSLLRIDADAIAPAQPGDAAFASVPTAVPTGDMRRALRLRVGEPSAYAAFLRSVPAEESDEEFLDALKALS